MALPELLSGRLSIPVVGAPMFIVSQPDLVIEQCKAGIVGSFPALNARPAELLDTWLERITTELADYAAANPTKPVAPFAVNQIVHASNDRLRRDVEACVRFKVPIMITSLRAPDDVVRAAHSYGGLVFHDVTNIRHAKRAIKAGVDGLILVCTGAGGHAGTLSPFALLPEIRSFYDGTILLAGAISSGQSVLAAKALGADLAYVGTRFIATKEAVAKDEYKEMLVESTAKDIVYTNLFSGIHGNYLRGSVEKLGYDADDLPTADKSKMNFGSGGNASAKAWKDIWSAGQGTGQIDDVPTTAELVERMVAEYESARSGLVG